MFIVGSLAGVVESIALEAPMPVYRFAVANSHEPVDHNVIPDRCIIVNDW